jgi:hypothetical protein
MNYKTTLFLLIFTVQFAGASTFRVDALDSVATGLPGETFLLEAYVHNITAGAIVVTALRKTNHLPGEWTASMCFGSSCYPPFVNEATEVIQPGDSLYFDLTFNTDSTAARGEILMKFTDIISSDTDSMTFAVETIAPPAFRLAVKDSAMTGSPGEAFPMETWVYNISGEPIVVQATRLTNDLADDWYTSMCFGSTCYAPGVSEISQLIPAGDSLLFDITFTTSSLADSGEALIQFTDLTGSQIDEQLFRVITQVPTPNFAVEFDVVDTTGIAGQELVMEGVIINLADSAISITLTRKRVTVPAAWSTALCLGDVCYAPAVSAVSDTISTGDSITFSIHFITDAEAASGSADLEITSAGCRDTLRQTYTAETTTTSLEDFAGQRLSFRLAGNYPNPFNNSTMIVFEAPEAVRDAQIRIYNASGQLAGAFVSSNFAAGRSEWRFDSSALSSGVYFYTLKLTGVGGQIYTAGQKFTLLK